MVQSLTSTVPFQPEALNNYGQKAKFIKNQNKDFTVV